MARTSLQRPDALAGVLAPGTADVSTVTTRHDDEVIGWRAGEVVIDLARAEPAEVGTAVDLAQPDSISCADARSWAAGYQSPARIGRGRDRLSPSWPSAIRLTNVFGTSDLIDARDRPDRDRRPVDGTSPVDRPARDAPGHDLAETPDRVAHRRPAGLPRHGRSRLGTQSGDSSAYTRKETIMYIGGGTVVLILIIVVVVLLMRGR